MKKLRKGLWLLGMMGVFYTEFGIQVQAEEYLYDELNRVTQVIYDDGSSVKYTYDKNGNIIKVIVDDVSPKETQSSEETEESESTEDTSESESSEEVSESEGEESTEDESEPEHTEGNEGTEDSSGIIETVIDVITDFFNRVIDWLRSLFG